MGKMELTLVSISLDRQEDKEAFCSAHCREHMLIFDKQSILDIADLEEEVWGK